MKLQNVLTRYNFSQEAKDIFAKSGIETLHPPQEETIQKGILEGKSIVMSVPTAAGKTLMAELCMVKSILQMKGRCIYIAPLKALASEKFNDFKNKYSSLGIKVGLAIGDLDSPSKYLNEYNIVVATAEKVDSLLRSKAKWLIDSLSVVVLDEIHFINDNLRGPTLEILTARIKHLNPEVQILALSATISNAGEMAQWLNAKLVKSDWRPIPLKEGVYQNEEIRFHNYPTRLITEEAPDDVSKLSLDTLRAKGQVLIFVNSRRSAQAVSRKVGKSIDKVLKLEERTKLQALSRKILGSKTDATKLCHKLADCITHGAAFHHAGLKPRQRELIEQNFKNNLIKVIGCTPTLAAGVNLPARRAIIRDCKRFATGVGQAYIPTSEYKQCAGRAGRPQFDDYGEAVIIAKTSSESGTLFEKYILADPEPVMSKLANETSLRIHILSSICGGYIHDINGMIEFLSHTFLHHQKQESSLLDTISQIFEFLHREKFIEQSGSRFFATPFGSLTSRLYIDPLTSIILRDGLNLIDDAHPFNPVGMLHMLTCTPDSPRLNVGKKDLENLEEFASHQSENFFLTPHNAHMLDDYYAYLTTLKASWMLLQWIEEEKEEEICDQFNIGPGDVYRHIDSIQWLLYGTSQIAHLNRRKTLTFQLEELRARIRYGIKEELLDLIKLKGVGRVRARTLFLRGFKKLPDFKFSTEEELGSLKQIGRSLAADILMQIAKKETKESYKTHQTSTQLSEETWPS